MEPIPIPRTIDDSPMLPLRRIDDLVPMTLLFMVGIATDM